MKIAVIVALIVAGALWYLAGHLARNSVDSASNSSGRLAISYFKSAMLFLFAGIAAFLVYGILLFSLSALVQYFTNQGSLEAVLFFSSYLKLVTLVIFSVWAWLTGKFLSKDGPKRWGQIGFCVFLIAPALPYIFSFLVA
ncbi:hypothetical protein [Marinobacter sp. S6332]|uniref:hypothetical protein n=1 Tax=Marinobacter sp. S6332 TaxID=2926403 RepID=UPI001FF14F7A|nr:hypothetical protein [Marinobacter sp. S6332]MCK0163179.1 hypothetical protein [Marinobacter sp. S6332]